MADGNGAGDADRRARWEKAQTRVFISHDTDEAGAFALRLGDDLELLGCSVWLASRDIAPGERWSPRLQEAIAQSTHVIALLVTGPVSRWVEYELDIALDRSMRGELTLVPVIARVGAVLPPLLTGLQAVDLSESYSTGLRELSGVLGVADALAGAESALLERWEAGRVQLDRHGQLLRQQLSNLRGVRDAEQRRREGQALRAEEARQAVAAGEAEAAALGAEARQAAQRAQELAARAQLAVERVQELAAAAARAQAEVDDRDGRIAGLTVRLGELHATHDPVLDLIDRAHRFLQRSRRLSPLETARDQDMVTLLERPGTVAPAVDVSAASRSPRGYAHRHRIAGALLAAVDRSALTGRVAEAVLARGLEAMDTEFPDGVELPAHGDDAALRDLRDALTRAVQQPDTPAGLGLSQALHLAFASYSARLTHLAQRTPAPVRSADTGGETPATAEPVPTGRLDVVVTGVHPATASSLGSRIRLFATIFSLVDGTLQFDAPSPSAAAGRVWRGSFPVVVLPGSDRDAARRARSRLTARGAQVELRPHAGGNHPDRAR